MMAKSLGKELPASHIIPTMQKHGLLNLQFPSLKTWLTPERHENCVKDGPGVVEEVGHSLVQADVGQFPTGTGFTQRTHLEKQKQFKTMLQYEI